MSTAISKSQIVARTAKNIRWPKHDVATVLDSVLETIGDELSRGNKVSLTGYLTFGFRATKAIRKGAKVRNPFSGEETIHSGKPAGLVVKVTVGKKLKQRAPSPTSKVGKALLSRKG